MGTPLSALQIGSSYSGLLKTTDNAIFTGTLRTMTDGLGNDSALQVSTTGVASLGTLAAVGALSASNFSGSHSGASSGTNTGDQTTISGNAATATALQTARAINGVNFDGTAAITVAAAAGTLTGATLNSGVTASSLTSLGTIASLSATAASVATTLGVTGLSTLASGAAFTTSVSAAQGTISYNSIRGLQLQGKTGSTYDFVLWGAGGTQVFAVPTGTVNTDFAGSITTSNGLLSVSKVGANSLVKVGNFDGSAALDSAIQIDTAGPANTAKLQFYTAGSVTSEVRSKTDGDPIEFVVGTTKAGAVNARGILCVASTTAGSGFRIPHGTAPTAPQDGEMWSTTAGLFIRINGVTKTVTLT